MDDQWVNARFEIIMPLEGLSVDADPYVKQEAVGLALERFIEIIPDSLWPHIVISAEWEDASEADVVS